MAVRGDDDIALRSHDHEVPTIAPELGYRTLRSSLAEEKGGVFLCFIEMRRQDHPIHHLLIVGGLHPALLHLTLCQLVEDMLVLLRDLLHVSLFRLLEIRCNHIEVGSVEIVMSLGKDLLFVVEHLQTAEVSPVVGKLFQFTLPVDGIEIFRTVPNADEINHRILVVAPAEIINIGVKRFRYVFLISCLKVIHTETIAVALITVAFH